MEGGQHFQSLWGCLSTWAVSTPLLDVLTNKPVLGFRWGKSLGDPSWRRHLDILGPSGVLEACPGWSLHGPVTEISVPLPLP